MTLWAEHSIPSGETTCFRIGPLKVWVRRSPGFWVAGWRKEGDLDGQLTGYDEPAGVLADEPPPNDLSWSRWAANADESSLRLLPVLPDRPVVARPSDPLRLPPGRAFRVYVRIPIFLRFVAGREAREVDLFEVPVADLSGTWFGDPVSGELCYALTTGARAEVPSAPLDPHRAVCGITVRNASHHEELDFDRICIRSENLPLYQEGERLRTCDVRVVFKGYARISEVRYAPKGDDSGARLSPPRKKPSDGVLKRSFSNFRNWTAGA